MHHNLKGEISINVTKCNAPSWVPPIPEETTASVLDAATIEGNSSVHLTCKEKDRNFIKNVVYQEHDDDDDGCLEVLTQSMNMSTSAIAFMKTTPEDLDASTLRLWFFPRLLDLGKTLS